MAGAAVEDLQWLGLVRHYISRGDVDSLREVYLRYCRGSDSRTLMLLHEVRWPVPPGLTRDFLRAIMDRQWRPNELEGLGRVRARLGWTPAVSFSLDDSVIVADEAPRRLCTIALVGERDAGKTTFANRLRQGRWILKASAERNSVMVMFVRCYNSTRATDVRKRPLDGIHGVIAMTACNTADWSATPGIVDVVLARTGAVPVVRITSKCDLLETVPPGGHHISARWGPVTGLIDAMEELLVQILPTPATDFVVWS